jgi:ABC-2 type transport system ATP-binding protein
MIELQNLSKQFGDLKAVDELSLNIPKGELFACLGPNGAGKTTTIKMLVGLLRPTAGSVRICDHDIQSEYVQAKALISYIPDVPFLYDKLTAREFLHFIVDIYPGLEKAQAEREMDELIALFGLMPHQHHLIEHYSHGMRQKLVFCAALIHHPAVMIIDEPMVGLDPHSSKIVKSVLKQKTSEGVTIFLSTHTLSVAEELADRIAIIDHGRLIAMGTLEELSQSAGRKGKLEDIFLRLTEDELVL